MTAAATATTATTGANNYEFSAYADPSSYSYTDYYNYFPSQSYHSNYLTDGVAYQNLNFSTPAYHSDYATYYPSNSATSISDLPPPPLLTPPEHTKTKSNKSSTKKEEKKKRFMRAAGGEIWEDPTLEMWDPNDFRIFCGDLGKEVTDQMLEEAFKKYPSFQRARVVREKHTNKSRGYGFVSFSNGDDFVRALREMNGKYVGNRPIKLRKSNWKFGAAILGLHIIQRFYTLFHLPSNSLLNHFCTLVSRFLLTILAGIVLPLRPQSYLQSYVYLEKA
ncbi:uncharacterized protein VTP21DRAFT_1927 [Calcarisporiella thermophila]|uniref:uncharacterized protein n=1 Tax=Calcarisporiella thermophila TaxID=911321 RepID=UPI0037426C60